MDWFGTRKKEEEVSPVALEGEECKVYMINLLTKYFHALSYLQLPTATALMKDKRVDICPSPNHKSMQRCWQHAINKMIGNVESGCWKALVLVAVSIGNSDIL